MKLSQANIKLLTDESSKIVHPKILENPKFSPWLDNCIGSLDGTQIPLHLSPSDQQRYRNRKGGVSHNVLAACDFDLRFTYVYPGWEGSANDQRVLQDAFEKGGLIVPYGKFFLADAGFVNKGTILTPFRNTRYHLKEFNSGLKDSPQTPQEIFNGRHSQIRIDIERAFGIVKRRFPILTTPRSFHKWKQIRLVVALAALHNWIRDNRDERDINEDIFDNPEIGGGVEGVGVEGGDGEGVGVEGMDQISVEAMNAFRIRVAKQMLEQYHNYKRLIIARNRVSHT